MNLTRFDKIAILTGALIMAAILYGIAVAILL
jgi:hypothetical protein